MESFISIYFFFQFAISQLLLNNMFEFINCLVNYTVVLLLVLCRCLLVQPLVYVYRWLLGVADTKALHCRLTTQHTTQPVATLMPPSTTPPRNQSVTQLQMPRQLITPRLPNTTPPRHWGTTPLHIMGKYFVTWSLNMPTTKYTSYLLSSRMKGEKRRKNSAADWASPLRL
jgi:hypothetical protein